MSTFILFFMFLNILYWKNQLFNISQKWKIIVFDNKKIIVFEAIKIRTNYLVNILTNKKTLALTFLYLVLYNQAL